MLDNIPAVLFAACVTVCVIALCAIFPLVMTLYTVVSAVVGLCGIIYLAYQLGVELLQ